MRVRKMIAAPPPYGVDFEFSQAALEALENAPIMPRPKKTKKRANPNDPPRDELGRFTKLTKKGKHAAAR